MIIVGTGIRTSHWCDPIQCALGLLLVPADSSLYRAVARRLGLPDMPWTSRRGGPSVPAGAPNVT